MVTQQHPEKGSGVRNVDSGLQVQLEKDHGRRQHNLQKTKLDGVKWSVAYAPF